MNLRAVYIFAATLTLVLIMIQPLVGALLRVYRGDRPVERLSSRTIDPGGAESWINLSADLTATRLREERNLNEYAWIERDKGIVRIPVQRAMELIARRSAASGDSNGPPIGEGDKEIDRVSQQTTGR